MRRPLEAWRRRWKVWTIPLGVVILQVLGLVVYQARFSDRNSDLETLLESRQAELERREEIRLGYEGFLERAAQIEAETRTLYRDRFATEAERFTAAVREVKTLAERAGLEPTTLSYPEERLEAYDLIGRGFDFGVEGTYEQLRTLINLLELSDHFLILQSVSLSGEGGASGSGSSRLSIRLEISTVFASPEAPLLSSEEDPEARG